MRDLGKILSDRARRKITPEDFLREDFKHCPGLTILSRFTSLYSWLTYDNMGGEYPLLWGECPHVHIVYLEDAVDLYLALDLLVVDFLRRALHDEPDQVACYRKRSRQRDDGEHKRANWVHYFVLRVNINNHSRDQHSNTLKISYIR